MVMMEIWTGDGRELTKMISEKMEISGASKIRPAIILEKLEN